MKKMLLTFAVILTAAAAHADSSVSYFTCKANPADADGYKVKVQETNVWASGIYSDVVIKKLSEQDKYQYVRLIGGGGGGSALQGEGEHNFINVSKSHGSNSMSMSLCTKEQKDLYVEYSPCSEPVYYSCVKTERNGL